MYRFFTSKPLWIALIILAALAVVWRLVARRLRVKKGEEFYRPYKKLLREAFRNDRESRNRVLEAIYYLRNGKPDKAEKIFQRLMVQCHDPDDYIAVRVMLALCYQRMHDSLKAVRYYRRVLEDAPKKRPVYQMICELNAKKNGRLDLVHEASGGIVFEEEEEDEGAGEE